MEIINTEPTDETPRVILDNVNNIFEFSGKSLPENAVKFYKPIMDWMESYRLQPNSDSVFVFKMDYFNTASSKIILDILVVLEEINDDNNGRASVEWCYREDDEDMEEAGEEYAEIVDIPFKYVAY